jgi:DNA-directed RNA polymerase specialized sigma24 family protein
MHGYLVHALGLLRIRRNDAEIRTWLFTIMHNLYLSRVWRRRPRRKSEPPEIDEDDLHAYIDGQLLIWRHLAVERNLEANPEAARRVAAYQAQRDARRTAFATRVVSIPWVKSPRSS